MQSGAGSPAGLWACESLTLADGGHWRGGFGSPQGSTSSTALADTCTALHPMYRGQRCVGRHCNASRVELTQRLWVRERKGGREGEREGEREGRRDEEKEGGREEGREGGRKGGREGGREEGRKRGREGVMKRKEGGKEGGRKVGNGGRRE